MPPASRGSSSAQPHCPGRVHRQRRVAAGTAKRGDIRIHRHRVDHSRLRGSPDFLQRRTGTLHHRDGRNAGRRIRTCSRGDTLDVFAVFCLYIAFITGGWISGAGQALYALIFGHAAYQPRSSGVLAFGSWASLCCSCCHRPSFTLIAGISTLDATGSWWSRFWPCRWLLIVAVALPEIRPMASLPC